MPNDKSCAEILNELRALADPHVVRSMARFRVPTESALGIPTPVLRKMAKRIGMNHPLAQELWKSRIHEARTLAALIDDPRQVTEAQAERWVADFDSWDVGDCCCGNLFYKTAFAYRKAVDWSRREGEFAKRSGFALMAALAAHDKSAGDKKFLKFLPILKRGSVDDRNFVKKAVNWALRQIGKRNLGLNRATLKTARDIREIGSPSARWIAADAIRELTSDPVQARLRSKRR